MPAGSPDPWWRDGALRVVRELAEDRKPFQCWDVATRLQNPPEHPAHWGSLMAEAKRLGIVRRAGYAPSRNPSRDGGVCAVWRGAA